MGHSSAPRKYSSAEDAHTGELTKEKGDDFQESARTWTRSRTRGGRRKAQRGRNEERDGSVSNHCQGVEQMVEASNKWEA